MILGSDPTQLPAALAPQATPAAVAVPAAAARRMTLLLVNYEYPPVGGGAAVASRSLARALQAQGHSVAVLTASNGDEPAIRVEDGVTVHRVRCLRRNVHDMGLPGALIFVLMAALRLPRIVRGAQFDCALFYFVVPTGLLAPLWSWLTRRPYVVALRGSDVPGYTTDRLLSWLHNLLKPVTARLLRRAAHVVANSDGLRELAQRAFARQPVLVIANGVDAAAFRPAPPSVGTAPALRALCVARLIRRKGIDLLVEALADPRCREVVVDVVGTGPELEELRRAGRARGVAARVNFLGHIDNTDLAAVYARADVFVLPSRSESCSMALLEAMSCGLPVIATRIGGMPELVQHGVNGYLVPTDDSGAIAACLDSLSSSPDLRRDMGRASREIVCEHHGWQRVADGYTRLFAEARG